MQIKNSFNQNKNVKGKGNVKVQCILNESAHLPEQYGTSFMKIRFKLRKLCWFEYSLISVYGGGHLGYS